MLKSLELSNTAGWSALLALRRQPQDNCCDDNECAKSGKTICERQEDRSHANDELDHQGSNHCHENKENDQHHDINQSDRRVVLGGRRASAHVLTPWVWWFWWIS